MLFDQNSSPQSSFSDDNSTNCSKAIATFYNNLVQQLACDPFFAVQIPCLILWAKGLSFLDLLLHFFDILDIRFVSYLVYYDTKLYGLSTILCLFVCFWLREACPVIIKNTVKNGVWKDTSCEASFETCLYLYTKSCLQARHVQMSCPFCKTRIHKSRFYARRFGFVRRVSWSHFWDMSGLKTCLCVLYCVLSSFLLFLLFFLSFISKACLLYTTPRHHFYSEHIA